MNIYGFVQNIFSYIEYFSVLMHAGALFLKILVINFNIHNMMSEIRLSTPSIYIIFVYIYI